MRREDIKETNREQRPVSLACHGGRFDDYDAFLFIYISKRRSMYTYKSMQLLACKLCERKLPSDASEQD